MIIFNLNNLKKKKTKPKYLRHDWHDIDGTHISDEPVSKMTVNVCFGSPISIGPTYTFCEHYSFVKITIIKMWTQLCSRNEMDTYILVIRQINSVYSNITIEIVEFTVLFGLLCCRCLVWNNLVRGNFILI